MESPNQLKMLPCTVSNSTVKGPDENPPDKALLPGRVSRILVWLPPAPDASSARATSQTASSSTSTTLPMTLGTNLQHKENKPAGGSTFSAGPLPPPINNWRINPGHAVADSGPKPKVSVSTPHSDIGTPRRPIATCAAAPAFSTSSPSTEPLSRPLALLSLSENLLPPLQAHIIVALRDLRRPLHDGKIPKYLVLLPNHPDPQSPPSGYLNLNPQMAPLLDRIGDLTGMNQAAVSVALRQGKLKLGIQGFATMRGVATDTAFYDADYVWGGPLCVVEQADFSYAVSYLWDEWMRDVGNGTSLSMEHRMSLKDYYREEKRPVVMMELLSG